MNFFTSRKPALLNFGLLLLFLAGWLFTYLYPAVTSLTEDDSHLFYGTVSKASIPSVFGGSNIPFFDKTIFQINNNDDADFILYASREILDDLSEWFSFSNVNASSIPLEVSAVRVNENRFVVHSLASTDWELDFDTLVLDYQVPYMVMGLAIVGVMGLASFVLLLLWLIKKRR